MFKISKDSPAFYLTSVAKDRLPVFRRETICSVTCKAIDEARKSDGFCVFAYVLMPDHLNIVTDSCRASKDILRYINGLVSRRVIDYLKENDHHQSLAKLRIQEQAKGYKYSLWQHHPNVRLLWSEEMLMQRINYTHNNPVRAGLVETANGWKYSSARIRRRCPDENEALLVDPETICWRAERGTASKIFGT